MAASRNQEGNTTLSLLSETGGHVSHSEGRDLVPLGFRSNPEGSCPQFRLTGRMLGGPSDRRSLVPLAVPPFSFSATWIPCSVQSLGSAVSPHEEAQRAHRDLAEEERARARGCNPALVCVQHTYTLTQICITHTGPQAYICPGTCHTQKHAIPIMHTCTHRSVHPHAAQHG